MALVTLREILKGSVENRYAVGSFNAANHSMAEAILEASEELGTPVILAVAYKLLDDWMSDDGAPAPGTPRSPPQRH